MLSMFDDVTNALEEIEPEDKTRIEVLYARVVKSSANFSRRTPA